MTDTHLDGNALGALFIDLFGQEMTDQNGCCDACGAINPLGRTVVYRDAPGDVMRCSGCGAVLIVAVRTATRLRISVQSLRWIELVE
ncbi:MAG: DUF6510 family protein [Acidimicrobiia bacterium]